MHDFQSIFTSIINKLETTSRVSYIHPLHGGLIHNAYQVTTDNKTYVIKHLNIDSTSTIRPLIQFELTEMVSRLFAKHAFPAVSAMPINHQYLQQVGDDYFLVYPYMNASPLERDLQTIQHTQVMGKLFGQMHRLKLADIDLSTYDFLTYDKTSNEELSHLMKHSALNQNRRLQHMLLNWNDQYHMALERMKKMPTILSHRDMHSQNVLWERHTKKIHIIDWESAGFIHPLVEVVGFGLEWSGLISNHNVNKTFLNAFIHSYFSINPIKWNKRLIHDAFFIWLGHCSIGWTVYNLKRVCAQPAMMRETRLLTNSIGPTLMLIAALQDTILDALCNTFNKLDDIKCRKE